MSNADRFTVINIVMVICVLVTFFSVYAPRERSRLYKPAVSLSIAACTMTMCMIAYFKGIYVANNWMFFIWIPLNLVVFGVFSKYTGGRYLVIVFLSLLSITSVNGLGFIIANYFFGWQVAAHILIRCGLMIIVTGLMGRYIRKPFAKALASVSKGWTLMAVVTSLFYILCVAFFAYPEPIIRRQDEYGFAILLIVTIYCAITLVMYTIINLSNENDKRLEEALRQNESRVEGIRLEQVEQQYKNIMNTLEQTSIIRHDLSHHFRMISEYCSSGQYDKINEYLEELNFENVAEEAKVYSRNYTVNVILSCYDWQCKAEDIRFSCETDIPEDIPVNRMDLSVLLGNAVENAVEACRRLESDRYVSIRIRYEKNKLLLDIHNSFDGRLKEEDGVLQSVKEQETHGFGMKSIQRVINKYDGYLHYQGEGGEFLLQVVLVL